MRGSREELKEKIYYAKSKLANGKQPTVKQHLSAVAELAGKYGAEIGMEKPAKLAGLFHDFGKYSDAFQGVLERIVSHIDHAQAGALILYKIYGKDRNSHYPVLEAINGHHDGLVGIGTLKAVFSENGVRGRRDCGNAGKTSALAGEEEYKNAYACFLKDFPGYKFPKIPKFIPTDHTDLEVYNLEKMLYTRMLFSCLVDADYSVSASDEHPAYLSETEQKDFAPDFLLEQLLIYQKNIKKKSKADGMLNQLRQQLFEQCKEAGKQTEGLYTLTAPTGTGKTLALLHFALHHCIENSKKRIIVVLPFLTLAEQNRDTYAKIVTDILVDHSQSGLDENAKEFAARWSKAFIITTSVKFFETLFAKKPTDCRKLHHIANSVILFDEAQSLPVNVTAATLRAVNELCRTYHCTMVFSSATQPDFCSIPHVDWKPVEIVPKHSEMFRKLIRIHVDWRLKEEISLEEIALEASKQKSVCVIVNLRRHAVKVFRCMKKICHSDDLFFMTTDLCVDHRSEIIERIHESLGNGKPCKVVATQCIEAGVDLDFDVLYRSLAPLESVIQSAGRCNRNGRIHEGGLVVVFKPQDTGQLYPGDWYKEGAELVERLSLEKPIDIHDPEEIKQYYQELFRQQKDKEKLRTAIKGCQYDEVEKEYKLISDQGVRVIVPWRKKHDEKAYEKMRRQLLETGITLQLMKKVAPITVTTFLKEEMLLDYAEPVFFSVKKGREKEASGYYILRKQCERLYTEDMGLQFPDKIMSTSIW